MKTSKLKNRRGSHIGVQPHLFATGMCGFVIVGTQFEHTDTYVHTDTPRADTLRYQQPRLKASHMTLLGKVSWRSQLRAYK